MMSEDDEVVTIKVRLGIGIANAYQEDEETILRSDWEAMTETEQAAYLDEAARDFGGNYINLAAWVVKEDAEEQ